MLILDIHSHHAPPYPEGIISAEPADDFPAGEGQFYSVGIHPWNTDSPNADDLCDSLAEIARKPWVVAIGECGTDPAKGAPMYRQLLLFRRQIEISESVGKPMVLHAVKSIDNILGMRRDTNASQPWAIHGFRSKPSVADMYLRAGMWISFGERFNADTLRAMPVDRILAETDISSLPIEDILALQAAALDMPIDEYRDIIAANSARFLQGENR